MFLIDYVERVGLKYREVYVSVVKNYLMAFSQNMNRLRKLPKYTGSRKLCTT